MPAKRDSTSQAPKKARATKSTRKPAAAKRSPKPPAKKASSTRVKRSPVKGKITSGWRRNIADRWVIHWRVFEKMPWEEIVRRDGRQRRTLERVVGDYLTTVEEGDVVPMLKRDPVELIQGMLSELTLVRDAMVGLMQSSDQETVMVAAGREWRRLLKEIRELLQGVGVLPKELGTMRHLVEVRELAGVLDKLLDRLEAGTITPQELRAQVAEWSGVQALPPPLTIEGTATPA